MQAGPPLSTMFVALAVTVGVGGCGDDLAPGDDGMAASGSGTGGETAGDDGLPPLAEGHARVVHSFGHKELAGSEEAQPCIQWTLNNEAPIYINKVTLSNDGGYHHSNWFVVPETYVPGEDGFFDCSSRGFAELDAAVAGTVLTAQSTQSRFEVMQLPEGVVVKAPPKHKIVAGGHLLNLSTDAYPTELRMELELIHPELVSVVTAPFRLSYYDLDIPAFSEARFSGECDIDALYTTQSGSPLDLTLYYVLPHYHGFGNYFDLSILGGPRDGESIFRLDGFNADANGAPMEPPLSMAGATGFSFTCGFNNWRDQSIGWGIGDQEMCVMLGLADSRVMMDASVGSGALVGEQDGILMHEGKCQALGLAKNAAQSLPTAQEIGGEMYVPPSDDPDLPVVDRCVDAVDVVVGPSEASLSNIAGTLLVSSCQFSSCHAGANAVGGLDFRAEDLHAELLGHSLQLTDTDMKLVVPGDAEASYLYQAIAKCEPKGDGSEPHMPLNSAELVNDKMIATVKAWIDAGAPNN